jgi:hypothetical protein
VAAPVAATLRSCSRAIDGAGWDMVGPRRHLPIRDRRILAERLAQEERHVAQGEIIIRRQRAVIENLRARGRDVALALELLERFKAAQAGFIETRNRLREELERLDQE